MVSQYVLFRYIFKIITQGAESMSLHTHTHLCLHQVRQEREGSGQQREGGGLEREWGVRERAERREGERTLLGPRPSLPSLWASPPL